MSRMAGWQWVLHDAGGNEMRASEEFESKEAAEAWMGQVWADLLDEGADTVSLIHDGHHQYRMGLRSE